ncbi:MAG: 2-oxo acid dehydrogenase subunit E2 [Phycisphaerales bacterium]|nr:2-oxo acid dehydrogenase subunit E2 [Phycisphaerae bacterium]NNF42682.1 2-oxo acid dehydrogenase subunit E2 [Phycisphaerales bacterium]NNM26661.1 2-oxo acid dehydrogenase subunit E2 [Phycisphaerales bacterium]
MAIKQPADKSHFILPDLGEGVHEAELIRWRVTPGETVEEHQVIAEMETDKALVEVPSPWAGTIAKLNGNEGDVLVVGSILVEYGTGSKAGAASPPKAAKNASITAKAAEANGEREDAGTVVGSVDATLRVSDAFTRRRHDPATATRTGKALATPSVRRIARERGVDINAVAGTGRGGRVTASDVLAFTGDGNAVATPGRTAAAIPSPPPAPVTLSADGIAERIPFRGVRRKIANALDRSVKTAVHFTVVDEADVTALEAKRAEYGRVLGRKISLLPFVMTAVCRALRIHPSLNANVDDEQAEILIKGVINLGCAVDTEHGLMVPVIDEADTLSLLQLADSVGEVARSCRNRTIDRERLVGGTFTISNVGSYGGMFATPIINYPEVAILAAGRAAERVLTKNGMFYAGVILPLSLSCDHRVVDGAEGARFLNTVVKLLEDPETLLGD